MALVAGFALCCCKTAGKGAAGPLHQGLTSNTWLVKGSVLGTNTGLLHRPMAGGAVGGEATGVVRKQAGYLMAQFRMVFFMVVTTRPGRRPPVQQ